MGAMRLSASERRCSGCAHQLERGHPKASSGPRTPSRLPPHCALPQEPPPKLTCTPGGRTGSLLRPGGRSAGRPIILFRWLCGRSQDSCPNCKYQIHYLSSATLLERHSCYPKPKHPKADTCSKRS